MFTGYEPKGIEGAMPRYRVVARSTILFYIILLLRQRETTEDGPHYWEPGVVKEIGCGFEVALSLRWIKTTLKDNRESSIPNWGYAGIFFGCVSLIHRIPHETFLWRKNLSDFFLEVKSWAPFFH